MANFLCIFESIIIILHGPSTRRQISLDKWYAVSILLSIASAHVSKQHAYASYRYGPKFDWNLHQTIHTVGKIRKLWLNVVHKTFQPVSNRAWAICSGSCNTTYSPWKNKASYMISFLIVVIVWRYRVKDNWRWASTCAGLIFLTCFNTYIYLNSSRTLWTFKMSRNNNGFMTWKTLPNKTTLKKIITHHFKINYR